MVESFLSMGNLSNGIRKRALEPLKAPLGRDAARHRRLRNVGL